MVVVVLVMFHGCRACVITGHPEDTVAGLEGNATLSCSTDFTICEHGKCYLHWQLEVDNKFEALSSCTPFSVLSGYLDRYSVSSGPGWSLTITGVQPSDVRRYRCSTYSWDQNSHVFSPVTLNIPSLSVLIYQYTQ